jgi:hypothetical protein
LGATLSQTQDTTAASGRQGSIIYLERGWRERQY